MEGNSIKSQFKQLIADFQRRDLPVPIPRNIDIPKLPKSVRKALVFIGMRRSGKTWAMYDYMQRLLKNGVKKEQFLYINFEDERLPSIQATELQYILEAYFELYPQYADTSKLYFFFDEINLIPGWEKFIRRLLESEKMMLCVSGSSAKMLSKEIATSLRGRTITREIFPFSFQEYLTAKKIDYSRSRLSTKDKAKMCHHVRKYLQYGGFPETISIDETAHQEILQNYTESVIYRDIVERYDVTNIHALHWLLRHCIQNAASLMSINKIYNTLKSQNYSVSKNSLYEYMKYFEDAYCIFSVPVYDFSLSKTILKPKKIYPVDTGLITAFTIKDGFDDASKLETAVFDQLRRKTQAIHYYQTKSGKEVDFLTIDEMHQRALYQVTQSLSNPSTKKREVDALREALDSLQLDSATILTEDEEGQLDVDGKKIEIIPIWRFMLDA